MYVESSPVQAKVVTVEYSIYICTYVMFPPSQVEVRPLHVIAIISPLSFLTWSETGGSMPSFQ